MKTIAYFLVTAALIAGTTARAQLTHEFKPALLDAREGAHRTIGARYNVEYSTRLDQTGLATHFSAGSKGTLTAKKSANPENLSAEIAGAVDWGFNTVVKLNPNEVINPNAPQATVASPWQSLSSADMKVRFETDQPFDNSQVLLGPRVSWVHTDRVGPRALLPSVFVSYDRVKVLADDFLSSLGVARRTFWRLEVDASWVWSPFEDKTTGRTNRWTPLTLHADVRYFESYNMPTAVKARSQDKNLYMAGTVSYALSPSIKYVHSVYATAAHGRLPPSTREDTTVYVGVVLLKKDR